jgi:hypothetical protein
MVIEKKDVEFRLENDLSGGIALWRGRRVGYLVSVPFDESARLLSDVLVFDRIELSSGPISRFVRKWFKPTFGVVNARQARVGTELVKQFLAKCEKAGVREVFGNVAVDALADHPFLLDWYEGLGFSRAPADGRAEFFPIASKVIWRNPKL